MLSYGLSSFDKGREYLVFFFSRPLYKGSPLYAYVGHMVRTMNTFGSSDIKPNFILGVPRATYDKSLHLLGMYVQKYVDAALKRSF